MASVAVHTDPENTLSHPITLKRVGSSLTFSRSRLIEVAEENIDIEKSGTYVNSQGAEVHVGKAIKNSIRKSKHYDIGDKLKFPQLDETLETDIHVCLASSLDATMALVKDGAEHVGVLNSACAETPGGTYLKGTLSFESCLCRGSLLLPSLKKFEKRRNGFYQGTHNQTKYLDYPEDNCAIYSPDVPIIREDTMEGNLLDSYSTCSFVSIKPPNAFLMGDGDLDDTTSAVGRALRQRLLRALCIFAEQGCTDIVLCSFGCGSRGNSPKMVAEISKEILSNEFDGFFETVIFAINPKRMDDFTAFANVFNNE